MGTACTGGYKEVQAVRPESEAGGGWFEALWNLVCPVGLSQREICAVRRKNQKLWSYVVKLELSRPKVAQNEPVVTPCCTIVDTKPRPTQMICAISR